MKSYVFERALFVVGEPDAGKSVQLRSMFRDTHLGTDGEIILRGNLKDIYRLSNDRLLYIRLSSPHEIGDGLEDGEYENYLDKTEGKLRNHHSGSQRWNFANALQPHERNNMPDVVKTVQAFVDRFKPERVRVAFLSPDRHASILQHEHFSLATQLQEIPSVECCWIDARSRSANGLFLADFFDFS